MTALASTAAARWKNFMVSNLLNGNETDTTERHMHLCSMIVSCDANGGIHHFFQSELSSYIYLSGCRCAIQQKAVLIVKLLHFTCNFNTAEYASLSCLVFISNSNILIPKIIKIAWWYFMYLSHPLCSFCIIVYWYVC